jgi:Ca-activated chloride channel family protein
MQNNRVTWLLAIFGVAFMSITLKAKQVHLNVALAKPVLKADAKETTYLKVGLTGFELQGESERPPVNVAIVMDKSGSMQGEKIHRAREAAKMAIKRLNRDDIISIVTYDSTVRVLVPATRISDRSSIDQAIDRITANGSTALFAGVSKGAAEVRKFLMKERVNRVILLSDGKANVGPGSPGQLAELGVSLKKEGISVSTIGLGFDYNEDLMEQLAAKSDGNHFFVDSPTQLAQIFDKELGDILSVVAQEVVIKIKCAPGIRPVRVIGRDAEISGQSVVTTMNQIQSNQEKYIILEVEVASTPANETRQVAKVNVSYDNMDTKTRDHLSSSVAVRFSISEQEVAQGIDRLVMVGCVTQIAAETSRRATALRDQGKLEDARRILTQNYLYLEDNGRLLKSDVLLQYGYSNKSDASGLDGDRWNYTRKKMRFEQQALQNQQASPLLKPK